MDIPDRERLLRRASILKSLAHPSRLLMIEMLEEAPRCVGELTEAVGADITTVSKHLAVLKRVGLVRDAREGQYNRYFIVCDCVSHLVDCIEEGMAEKGSDGDRRSSSPERHCPVKHRNKG